MTERIELTTINRPVPAFVAEKLKELTNANEYTAVERLRNQGTTPLFDWLYDNSRHKTGNKGVLELMSLLTLGYKVANEEKYYLVVNDLYVNLNTENNKISFEDKSEFMNFKTKFTEKEIKNSSTLAPFGRFKVPVNG